MDRFRVHYRRDEDTWVATSPEIHELWMAVGDSLGEVQQLAEDGVRFALGRNDIVVEHLVPART